MADFSDYLEAWGAAYRCEACDRAYHEEETDGTQLGLHRCPDCGGDLTRNENPPTFDEWRLAGDPEAYYGAPPRM